MVYERTITLYPTDLGWWKWEGASWEIPFCENWPCFHSFTVDFARRDQEPSKSLAIKWQVDVTLGDPDWFECSDSPDAAKIKVEIE
jgi:hypothetical protein